MPGRSRTRSTGAVAVPIYQTSTYKQDGVGGLRGGYEYSRSANPTRTALEECLAAIEGGARGLAFASGLAAEDTLLRTVCAPGDHVMLPGDAYGGTFRLVAKVFDRWGLHLQRGRALHDVDAVRAAVRPNHQADLVRDADQPAARHRRHRRAAPRSPTRPGRCWPWTTPSPRPTCSSRWRFGADVVVHSTTKYLGGHSDVVGGALVAASAELGEQLAFHQNAMGAVAGPFDAWLVLRGIKTLGVRMDRHCANAARMVEALSAHPAVDRGAVPGPAGLIPATTWPPGR